jgi:tellurite resistance protein TehA-like permease
MVPTLWIVLGPLGQSITAVSLLAKAGPSAVPAATAQALHEFALIYGVPVWGFAAAWLVLAVAITVKTARDDLPFAPTWWSFTFPLGTVVTGSSELALFSGVNVLKYVAVVLYVAVVGAWVVVAGRTVATLLRGRSATADRQPETLADPPHDTTRLVTQA